MYMTSEKEAELWQAFDDTALEFVASVKELRVLGWEEYFVITAWNPYSQKLSFAENQARNLDLISDLLKFRIPFARVIGHSSTWDWVEEGFAIKDLEIALKLGKKYEQHAIFAIRNEEKRTISCLE